MKSCLPPRAELLLGLLLCAACDPEPDASEDPTHERAERGVEPLVVFESVRVLDRDGVEVSSRSTGERTLETYQRAARPWSYLDERDLYHEVTWSRPLADGQVEYGHQIVREVNPSPVEHQPDVAPTRVDAGVTALLAEATAPEAADTQVDLHLRVRDFPDWDIPLLPPATGFSADERQRAIAGRDAAIAARAELLDTSAAALIEDIEALGGEVVSRRPSIGWLFVRVPLASLPRLVQHPDIARIVRPDGALEFLWKLGHGRQAGRLNADTFWSHGFDGGQANPGRHAVGRISVGVIDDGLDDEACTFLDGANCTGASRIQARFKCWNNPADYCQALGPGQSFAQVDEGLHGTVVSSILLGDYMDNQGTGVWLDEPANWPGFPNHSDDFENERTGMAPEAGLTFLAITDVSSNALKEAQIADALADTVDRHLDVVNLSLRIGNSCRADALHAFEEEAENAYDDGVLVVAAAGNEHSTTATECQIGSPADLIKTIAVNGFDTSSAYCVGDYHHVCTIMDKASARGGSPAVVNGVTYPEALSGIDMAAPTNVLLATDGDYHTAPPIEEIFAAGSSSAAPHVTGLAALLKDQYLSAGQEWINSPGRLHTILLAHTDRHYSEDPSEVYMDTEQRTAGADPWYGLGRITMKLSLDLAPWRNSFSTWSFTQASADRVYFPFGSEPMPAGVEIAKCVMTMSEDMTNKSDISDINLILRVRQPDASGSCTASGALGSVRSDTSKDTKSMVAFVSSQALAGRCLEVTLDKVHVTPAGITTHTICYHAGQRDDE